MIGVDGIRGDVVGGLDVVRGAAAGSDDILIGFESCKITSRWWGNISGCKHEASSSL